MQSFKVAPNRSILLPTSNADAPLLVSGQRVPEGMFSKSELDRKIRDGFIVPEGMSAVADSVPVVRGPRTKEDAVDQKSVPHFQTGVGNTVPFGVKTASNPAHQPVRSVSSLWVLDPDSLKSKTLTELQVMILERDSDFVFSDDFSQKDAVDALSRDFKRGRKG